MYSPGIHISSMWQKMWHYSNVLPWHTYIINVTENVTLLKCTHLAYIYHQCDRKCDTTQMYSPGIHISSMWQKMWHYSNVLPWHTYIINVTENVTLLKCTHLAYIYHQCDRKCDTTQMYSPGIHISSMWQKMWHYSNVLPWHTYIINVTENVTLLKCTPLAYIYHQCDRKCDTTQMYSPGIHISSMWQKMWQKMWHYSNVLTWHTYIINVTENVTLLKCTHLAYIYHQCDRKCDRKCDTTQMYSPGIHISSMWQKMWQKMWHYSNVLTWHTYIINVTENVTLLKCTHLAYIYHQCDRKCDTTQMYSPGIHISSMLVQVIFEVQDIWTTLLR